MSSYLITNYKGKYQLKAEIDKNTGDFCRDEHGNLDNYSDIWIVCEGKGRVYHFGHSTLQYYIPRLKRGRSIIKEIQEVNKEIIFDIEETDEEVLFKFKASNFDTIKNYIKPRTFCASRSPFSNKYIPRTEEAKNYAIPLEDLEEYKEITSVITQNDISVYRKINNGFLTVLSKKKRIPEDILKKDIKLSGFKFKEYVHKNGLFKEYLHYIKEELKDKRWI